MASLLRLRVFLPLAVLCLCGCLSEETISPGLRKEDPQDHAGTGKIIHPKQNKKSCNYEEDLRFTPIIERDVWVQRRKEVHTHLPVTYIVVRDGGKTCEAHAECLASVSSELQATANEVCSTLDNFYVGGDGEVYEGRGWRVSPYWHLNGMRRKAVTVKFLGGHESEPPSERAMRAFWRMATTGVWEANLSPGYKVVSMGQVYNDSTLVGKALEKVFQESDVILKKISLVTTWEMIPDKSLPLITREEWGARKPTKPMTELGNGIKYVMINEGGERCFTPEDCKSRIKAEQEQQLPIYGDLVDNFYIGDDGHVYEGRGYSYKPLWDTEIKMENNQYFKDESLTVRFFGNFQSEHPSEEAIGALKLLIKAGNSIKTITDRYKLYSLRGIYNDSRFLGDRFFEIAREWTPWADELDDRLAKEPDGVDGFIGMVKRTDWEAKEPKREYTKIKHPVGYVIINDNSDPNRCFSSERCLSVMKEIQGIDREEYGDVVENFYISDTGNVYEGRGWDTESHCQPKYFNGSLITVNFIGNHKEVGASTPALAAFDKLIRVGVKLGKIAPNHQFYSFRNVYDADSLLGEELKKRFEKNERWSKKLDTMTEDDRLDSGLLPLIPNTDWSDISTQESYLPYTDPIQYVVIGHKGKRCHTHEECTAIMKGYNRGNQKGVWDNFYIGDDGMAYEGRGWTFAPSMYSKGFKSKFYYLAFLGQHFNESAPSKISILALNRLLENGVRTQKLSPDFKIMSAHQVFEGGTVPSDNLHNAIKTWDRWTSDVSAVAEVEGTPLGPTVFVRRSDWKAEKPLMKIATLQQPVSYVVVHNVGDHCSDLASCIKSVQTIQKNTPPRYWDVPDNFYVGDDGHIYEGRGWHYPSLWVTKGIENNILSVGFLGSTESVPPSPKALFSFHILQQTGILKGALENDFKTISLGEIMKGTFLVTGKLIGALNVTDHWSSVIALKYDRARLRSLTSPFVLSHEWNLSKLPIRMSSELRKPIKYIAIRDGGAACDTSETCMTRIRKEHEDRHASSDGGVAENFYIGNDGNVYEGAGWDWDMVWGFDNWRESVSVQFFGSYEDVLPSAEAIEAFNAVILRDGVATGKLSPNYKIGPTPKGEGRTLGNKFREEVMTWKNAIPDIEKA